ncbi:MAG: TatD family hydrolase [Clostridia bacterium]|nr:TatD family hydrolase [Clostridia bacterium]
MRYFDSHAHYWDDRFKTELEGSVDDFLDALLEKDVAGIVNVGTSPETSLLSIAQAKRHQGMFAAAGIHPSDAASLPSLKEALCEIRALFDDRENKLVAVGEIGLDYHFLPFDKQMQTDCFASQMALAEDLALPVIIHDREAHGDCLGMVRRFPRVTGVFHSYSGSIPMAEELVSLGYMISFSGTVSFKNARHVKEVASSLPKEAVLVETDCPYLAPHPHRGKLNHSGLLPCTLQALAEVWGISADECAFITHQNALRLFRLPLAT